MSWCSVDVAHGSSQIAALQNIDAMSNIEDEAMLRAEDKTKNCISAATL